MVNKPPSAAAHYDPAMAGTRSAGVDELSARPAWQPIEPVSLQTWITGQDRVRPSNPPPAEAGNPKDDRLIAQLGEIGRDPTELERKDLTQYRALLESAEVQQRAGTGADNTELAKCAVRAIKDFIDKVDDDTEKQVVMAALAVTEQFSGTGITKRMPAGVSKSTFQRIRDRQFVALAEDLRCYTRTAIQSESDGIQLTDEQNTYIQYSLDSMMRAAFALHFAGLAKLFAREHKGHVNHAVCDEYLFDTFLHFLARAANWSAIPAPARVAGAGEDHRTHRKLTSPEDEGLISLIADVTECWPLATEKYDRPGMYEIYETVHELGSLYHRDLYDGMWRHFYKDGSPYEKTEAVTVRSGLLAEALYPFRRGPTEWEEAEYLAMRTLEVYYWTNDLVFKQSISAYFSENSIAKTLKW